MFSSTVLLFACLLYLGLLFAVAWWGDRRSPQSAGSRWRPWIYSLTLAVYCSSWTFYGAVGSAAHSTWSYLPIYLGPLLLLWLAPGPMRRLIALARERAITSIADLVGTRYGKSTGLAALITGVALVAAIPYIALQLRAVTTSIEVLSGAALPVGDTGLWVALLLALFAILFGTRNIDAREHHHGLMLAVALESMVKLVAFLAIAAFALWQLGEPPSALARRIVASEWQLPDGFAISTLLSMLAMFCLPRQFQVAVVECADSADFERARRGFGLYLVLISLGVLPILWAGQSQLGAGVHPDTWVLRLPMLADQHSLAMLTFLGGFSAATGMVIVASVALATMVSNHLVVPLMLRAGWSDAGSLSGPVLWARRATILLLGLLGYAYYRTTLGGQPLASIGLLAFAAVAQFAPAILAGLYWVGASRRGALAGLGVGVLLWAYTLLLPQLLPGAWVEQGPLGIGWLQPTGLFGIAGWDAITHGTVWSLLGNVLCLILVSLRYRPRLDERLYAARFLDRAPQAVAGEWQGNVATADVRALAERILGARAAERAFADYAAQRGERPLGPRADRALLQFIERQLAGAIGAASARRVLTTTLRGRGLDPAEVVSLLDETSQQLRFNRELLAATLDNIAQGISVVDAELRLVAWNRRYLELFDYPDGMVFIGRPVADLIRWNAERGECGPGDVEQHVRKRLRYMQQGSAHVYQRTRADGRVIEMRGQPMPGGGFATTFTDITEFKRSEQALIEAKSSLEQRVDERTQALREALEAQRQAKQEAEAANRSKSRFLAAASHDLVQPMNAARLFAAALAAEPGDPQQVRSLGERIDASLRSAEELLAGLLEISRLESGNLKPELSRIDARELCAGLITQFAPMAAARDLDLRWRCPPRVVQSDRVMLRRILQNFLSNALRYTRHGGVLLAGRCRGGLLRLEVWDTGPGIPEQQSRRVFEEFARLDAGSPWGEQGLGLGLSICERSAALLGHRLDLRSRPGRGSVFAIEVPISGGRADPLPEATGMPVPPAAAALRVLCLDDNAGNLVALDALLQRWSLQVRTATGLESALASVQAEPPDLLLVDYRLGEGLDGFAAISILRQRCGGEVAAALVTADRDSELLARARELGLPVLAKPVAPAALRALIDAVAARRRHSSG